MNSKLLGFVVILSTLLTSCCDTEDSRVPDGSPYGDWQQLRIQKTNAKFIKELFTVFSSNKIKVINKRSKCDTLIKRINPNCNCNDIDFDKYMLVMFDGTVYGGYSLYETAYQPRAIINHKVKSYLCELRGMRKTCSSTTNLSSPYGFHDLYLVPTLPDNYSFDIKFISPIIPD